MEQAVATAVAAVMGAIAVRVMKIEVVAMGAKGDMVSSINSLIGNKFKLG